MTLLTVAVAVAASRAIVFAVYAINEQCFVFSSFFSHCVGLFNCKIVKLKKEKENQ